MRNILYLLLISLLSTACSSWQHSSAVATGTQGGLSGAVIGAGTGALVGSAISGGQVGRSALAGAGIGLAAGTAGALVYRHVERESALHEGNSVISAQEAAIRRNDAQIQSLRKELSDEAEELRHSTGLQQHPFQGVTVQSPY